MDRSQGGNRRIYMDQSQAEIHLADLLSLPGRIRLATSFLLFLLCWELPLVSSPILQQPE